MLIATIKDHPEGKQWCVQIAHPDGTRDECKGVAENTSAALDQVVKWALWVEGVDNENQ